MSRSLHPRLVSVTAPATDQASRPPPASHWPCYLVIDHCFGIPTFVFLELDPRTGGPGPAAGTTVLGVTLEVPAAVDAVPGCGGLSVRSDAAIGRDPQRWDHFQAFRSDDFLRAAGFALIEPRYVGPDWESYLGVFRPEGTRRLNPPQRRILTGSLAG